MFMILFVVLVAIVMYVIGSLFGFNKGYTACQKNWDPYIQKCETFIEKLCEWVETNYKDQNNWWKEGRSKRPEEWDI